MKRYRFLLLILPFIVLLSCEDDADCPDCGKLTEGMQETVSLATTIVYNSNCICAHLTAGKLVPHTGIYLYTAHS